MHTQNTHTQSSIRQRLRPDRFNWWRNNETFLDKGGLLLIQTAEGRVAKRASSLWPLPRVTPRQKWPYDRSLSARTPLLRGFKFCSTLSREIGGFSLHQNLGGAEKQSHDSLTRKAGRKMASQGFFPDLLCSSVLGQSQTLSQDLDPWFKPYLYARPMCVHAR